MLEVYEALAKELQVDAIVLADGGTDSLMQGDEDGLGTPMEVSNWFHLAHSLTQSLFSHSLVHSHRLGYEFDSVGTSIESWIGKQIPRQKNTDVNLTTFNPLFARLKRNFLFALAMG